MSANTSHRKQKQKQRTGKSRTKSTPSLDKYGNVNFSVARFTPRETFRFRRFGAETTVAQVASVDALGSFQFTLSGVSNYTELTALFDTYRIRHVKITFRPRYNFQTLTTSALVTPRLYTAIDLDDNATPASLNEIEQYSTLHIANFDQTVVRSISPRVAGAVYGSGVFTSFSREKNSLWIDAASPNAAYYGCKWGITAGAVGQTSLQEWTVTFEYFLEFQYSR